MCELSLTIYPRGRFKHFALMLLTTFLPSHPRLSSVLTCVTLSPFFCTQVTTRNTYCPEDCAVPRRAKLPVQKLRNSTTGTQRFDVSYVLKPSYLVPEGIRCCSTLQGTLSFEKKPKVEDHYLPRLLLHQERSRCCSCRTPAALR